MIKAVMALLAGALLRRFGRRPVVTSVLVGLAAECIMVLGYLGYEGALLGYGWAAAGSADEHSSGRFRAAAPPPSCSSHEDPLRPPRARPGLQARQGQALTALQHSQRR
ncbi:MAG: hypothetical protein ACLUEK_12430 [Oscillospiraceae bacterium]